MNAVPANLSIELRRLLSFSCLAALLSFHFWAMSCLNFPEKKKAASVCRNEIEIIEHIEEPVTVTAEETREPSNERCIEKFRISLSQAHSIRIMLTDRLVKDLVVFEQKIPRENDLQFVSAFERTKQSRRSEPNLIVQEHCAETGELKYHAFKLQGVSYSKIFVLTTNGLTLNQSLKQEKSGHCELIGTQYFDNWGHFGLMVPVKIIWTRHGFELGTCPKPTQTLALIKKNYAPLFDSISPSEESVITEAPAEFAEFILRLMNGNRMAEAKKYFDKSWSGSSSKKDAYWKFLNTQCLSIEKLTDTEEGSGATLYTLGKNNE